MHKYTEENIPIKLLHSALLYALVRVREGSSVVVRASALEASV